VTDLAFKLVTDPFSRNRRRSRTKRKSSPAHRTMKRDPITGFLFLSQFQMVAQLCATFCIHIGYLPPVLSFAVNAPLWKRQHCARRHTSG
jgi:hypothetical protein